jgi:hypothetical protein
MYTNCEGDKADIGDDDGDEDVDEDTLKNTLNQCKTFWQHHILFNYQGI